MNHKILVVEDELIVSEDIKTSLEAYGYEVVATVESGEEAIEFAKKGKPDLIIMDIMLKGQMNGIEASREIKKILEVPIIYLSAYADVETVKKATETSPYGYVVKPFEENELVYAVEVALEKFKNETKLKKKHEN